MVDVNAKTDEEIAHIYTAAEARRRIARIKNSPQEIEIYRWFGYDNFANTFERLDNQLEKAKLLKTKDPDFSFAVNLQCLIFIEDWRKSCDNIRLLHDYFECLNFYPFSNFKLSGDIKFYKGKKRLNILDIETPIAFTEFDFSIILTDLAKKLLAKSIYPELLDKADAQEILKMREKFAKHDALTLSLKDEKAYTKRVKEWIKSQIEYMKVLQECKQTESTTDNLPKTIQIEGLTEQQIKNLRKNLIDRLLIKNIKEEDFIYLFSGKPIKEKMPQITPTKKFSVSTVHSLFKHTFGIEPIDYKTINKCFKTETPINKNSFSVRGEIPSNYRHPLLIGILK